MSRQITQIKVWKNSQKTECRIYVDFAGATHSGGCYYLTGNHWQQAKSLENMTAEELAEAKKLALVDGQWTTIWASEMTKRNQTKTAPSVAEQISKQSLNRYAEDCRWCGKHLEAGQGEVIRLDDEEDIDFIGHGSKWIVTCIDGEACKARQAEHKAERDAERAAQSALPEATVDQKEAFWNDFFEATDYIGS